MSIAGGVVFRLLDGRVAVGGVTAWPGVTLLIPAYNEELVIGTCVRAALAVDYAPLEILVLDDGSTDETAHAATAAAAGDRRVTVLQDPVNRGKAERLNIGLERGRSTLEIADQLQLSRKTVRNHVRHLLHALGAASRLEAVALARGEHL